MLNVVLLSAEDEKVRQGYKITQIGPMPKSQLAKSGDSKSSSTDSGLQMEEVSGVSETTSL